MESGTELYQYKLLRGAGLLRPVVFLKFFSFSLFLWMDVRFMGHKYSNA